jgi:plasmid stabilization system protein ParE
MSRSIRKSVYFTADFEILFAWYVSRAGAQVAWRFQTALNNSLSHLSIRPDLGRPRHFHHRDLSGLRSITLERPFHNLVFYRAGHQSLDAVCVMHGARNLPRRLREPPSIDEP